MPVTPTTPTPATSASASAQPPRADRGPGSLQSRGTEQVAPSTPARPAPAASADDAAVFSLRRRRNARAAQRTAPLNLGNDVAPLKKFVLNHTDVGRFLPRESDPIILEQARFIAEDLADSMQDELNFPIVSGRMSTDERALVDGQIVKLRSLFKETGVMQRAPQMLASLVAYIPAIGVAARGVPSNGSIVLAFQMGNSSKNAFQALMLATQSATSPQAIKEHYDYRLMAPFLISAFFVADALSENSSDRSPSTQLGLVAAAVGVGITAAKWNSSAIASLIDLGKQCFSAHPINVSPEVLDPVVAELSEKVLTGTRQSIEEVQQLRKDSSSNAVVATNISDGLGQLKKIEAEMAKILGQDSAPLDNADRTAKLGVAVIGAAMVAAIVSGFMITDSMVGASLNGGFGSLSTIELVKGALDGSVGISDQITRLASTQGQSPLIILFLFLEYATGAAAGNESGVLNTGGYDETLAMITFAGMFFNMFGPEMAGLAGASIGERVASWGSNSNVAPAPLSPVTDPAPFIPVTIEELSSDEESDVRSADV